MKTGNERLFKVLNANGTACHGGTLRWSLPNGRPGAWHAVTGSLVPCERGLHLCRERDLLTWLGPALYLAETDGERLDADDKIVVRRARLVARLETWTESAARHFAVACARRALERERAAGRELDARSWAALDVATAVANGHLDAKALTAAEAAARAASGAAAGAAAWAAAGAAGSGGAAAGAAAWAAAGAAMDAAWEAERQWQTAALLRVLFPEEATR